MEETLRTALREVVGREGVGDEGEPRPGGFGGFRKMGRGRWHRGTLFFFCLFFREFRGMYLRVWESVGELICALMSLFLHSMVLGLLAPGSRGRPLSPSTFPNPRFLLFSHLNQPNSASMLPSPSYKTRIFRESRDETASRKEQGTSFFPLFWEAI